MVGFSRFRDGRGEGWDKGKSGGDGFGVGSDPLLTLLLSSITAFLNGEGWPKRL